jgi:hypothetical protein
MTRDEQDREHAANLGRTLRWYLRLADERASRTYDPHAFEASCWTTDCLAYLAGRLGAAVEYDCPLSLLEVSEMVERVRTVARVARDYARFGAY